MFIHRSQKRLKGGVECLLSQYVDFKTEKTDLENLCIQLGTNIGIKSTILYTPKFHCKLAGEGIEYAWGAATWFYRRTPLNKKRTVAGFETLVHSSIDSVNPKMCRQFAAKARSYIYVVLSLNLSSANGWRRR